MIVHVHGPRPLASTPRRLPLVLPVLPFPFQRRKRGEIAADPGAVENETFSIDADSRTVVFGTPGLPRERPGRKVRVRQKIVVQGGSSFVPKYWKKAEQGEEVRDCPRFLSTVRVAAVPLASQKRMYGRGGTPTMPTESKGERSSESARKRKALALGSCVRPLPL